MHARRLATRLSISSAARDIYIFPVCWLGISARVAVFIEPLRFDDMLSASFMREHVPATPISPRSCILRRGLA